MELREVRYFLALADELNFTRAATRCWVSQQAFSKAIAGLERRLGTDLVVRRSRGCSLTAAGHRLAATGRDLVRRADELQETVAPGPTFDADPLRVGLLLDGLGPLTRDVLTGYRASGPDRTIRVCRIQPSDLPGALLSGRLDVALVHGPVTDDRVAVQPLFGESRIVAVSAGDPRAAADHLTTDDLLDLPARTRRPTIDPSWEGFFTLVSERNGEEPERTGAPTGSLEELFWSISLEHLFITMPGHLAATYDGDSFGVRFVPVPDLEPVVFSVVRRRDDERAAVRAFTHLAIAMTSAPATA